MLEVSCNIDKVCTNLISVTLIAIVTETLSLQISLELIAEDQTTLNCIGASIEGLKMKLKQDKFCHQAHLEVVNLSLMDSSIDAGGESIPSLSLSLEKSSPLIDGDFISGVEVRSLIPIISTQGNKNGKFLSVDFSMVSWIEKSFMFIVPIDSVLSKLQADSPDLKMKHQNNVTADIGPIAFFISDASLFCWTKMLGRVYQRVTPISLKKSVYNPRNSAKFFRIKFSWEKILLRKIYS